MPDLATALTVLTRRYIRTTPAITDNIFNQDPLNELIRRSLNTDFTGGSLIQEDFLYDTLIGGNYAKGKRFNTAQKQTEQACQFDMRYTQVGVSLYQEDIEVINKGPQATVKLVRSRIDQAYMALGAFVSIATYLPGSGSNYTTNVNGLAEIISNGVDNSWNGSTYATYGGLTRANYNSALNSPKPINLASGSIEYDTIDSAYTDIMYGSGEYEPNIIVTTPKGLSYLRTKFQTQQRFQDSKLDIGVGFRSLKFMAADCVASRYCPGSIVSTSGTDANRVATNFLSESTAGAVTTYPSITGESMFILNARRPWLNYYVSDSPVFGGGFREFIPSANSTELVGQVLLAHQLTANPKYHTHIYGFIG